MRVWRICLEFLFVLTNMMVLKIWVFPFFISLWFPTNDLSAQMLEWTVLMVGIVTCFIYIGLGSSAKYHHQCSIYSAIWIFLMIHVPLFVPGFELFQTLREAWQHLIGDIFTLFAPHVRVTTFELLLIQLGLFLLGRWIQVQESPKSSTRMEQVLVKEKR